MPHDDRQPAPGSPRVAFDVATRRRWTGAAEQRDIRDSTWIEPPELPWPLRFDFVRALDDDRRERWVLAGFEIGAPIPRDAVGRDTDEFELSPERVALLWDNFSLYKRMAEDLLVPTPTSAADAVRTRAAMGRRKRRVLTDDYLAVLAAEHRERLGEPGLEYAMAAERGIDRSTLYRQLKLAERRGL